MSEASVITRRLPLARELGGVEPAQARRYVGDLIRVARRDAGMSAQQLADALEPPVTVSTVTSWERGRTTPGPFVRDQLEVILGDQLDGLELKQVRFTFMPLTDDETAAAQKAVLDAMCGLSLEGLTRLADYADLLRCRYPAEGAGGGGGDARKG